MHATTDRVTNEYSTGNIDNCAMAPGMTNSAARRTRLLILGAAGRDYHTFNTMFRNDPSTLVVCFTHAQIPHIASSRYPPELSGKLYPEGIPIYPEERLESIVEAEEIDECIMAYSDVAYPDIVKLSARVRAAGARFTLLGKLDGMVKSVKPVIAVTAVRTGCGKSQACKLVIEAARGQGKRIVLIRHPMPYGDLAKQAVQRFETLEDLKLHDTTIEEREEYEQHIRNGVIVYAGVDYEAILRQAEAEADLVLWDGGNNDLPFYKPDLWIVVADPHRPGHEISYYPGDINFRCADVVLVNKANTAKKEAVEAVLAAAKTLNPMATCFVTASEVTVSQPELIRGKRVLCVEDGPTITHGGMPSGAALVAAEKYQAGEVVDPREKFMGEMAVTLKKYPHIGPVMPAMGYSEQQLKDLEASIAGIDCDVVLLGTPQDLTQVITISQPVLPVSYEVQEMVGWGPKEGCPTDRKTLKEVLSSFIKQHS